MLKTRAASVGMIAVGALWAGVAAIAQEPTPLKEAKLIIEYNATDDDIGFQGFIDSEGWQRLVVTGPAGEVLRLEGLGALGELGLTELFFETVEPAEDDVPKTEVLAALPEGEYLFEGPAMEAGESLGPTRGIAVLTHDIPAAPELTAPTEAALIPAGPLPVSWEPVTQTIDGRQIDIIAYQLIIQSDEDPHPNMIGKMGLSIYLPATVTEIIVPGGFLQPDTAYEWEVLAIEASGNQTISSRSFRTE
jgi:hypothetical protein